MSYEYDTASNLIELTYPDGERVAYGYDSRNRVICAEEGAVNLSSPCNSTGRRLATVSYDDLSRRQQVTFANGSGANFAYTHKGNRTCHDLNFTGVIPADCGDAGAELGYAFTHNGVGQLLSKYVSDDQFVWRSGGSFTTAYAVNGLNQYTQIGGVTTQHDLNGNLITDHRGQTYTYDAENVLRSASGLVGGSASYRYYADGSRRSKNHAGSTSSYYYMGGLGYLDDEDTEFAANQEVAEYQSGNLVRRHYRLPGSVDEVFLSVDFDLDANCTIANYSICERWVHQDRQGSTVALTDSAGAQVAMFTYSPYGKSGLEGDSGFPFRYTGQKLDAETGLYYYKARYYDPEIGRFLQTDPIGYGDNMNMYAYVGNDPGNNSDPSGRNVVTKFIKQTIKNKGDVIESFVDVGGELVTIFSPSSTPLDRIISAAELLSPISLSDIKDAKKAYQNVRRRIGGRLGNAHTRAQNRALGDRATANGGTVTNGQGAPDGESYFPGDGPGSKGGRYSDGTVIDANGNRVQVQTVDTRADGSLTRREHDAAVDIAERSGDPVVCVVKKVTGSCN